MSEDHRNEDKVPFGSPVGRMYLVLILVPVLAGMLGQFILAPEEAAWGVFEVGGMIVAAVLAVCYSIVLLLQRVR